MTDDNILRAKPLHREPVHASLTREQVSELVEQFYQSIQADERLGPIFATQMSGEWPQHLETMKAFWRSVLLKTGEYKGKPVPAHAKLDGVTTADFQRWLNLFEQTAEQIFIPEVKAMVTETARRIASSLWLARAEDPFAAPPQWGALSEQRRMEK